MEDISKTTIAVLLILVVLISVIGTWVVLNSIITIQQPTTQLTQSHSQGNLRLTVLPPPEPPTKSADQATIKLTVLRPGEKEEV